MATKRKLQVVEKEAKKILKNDPVLAAEIAGAWAKKNGYLFLPKEDNTTLEKSGGWGLAMRYKATRGKQS